MEREEKREELKRELYEAVKRELGEEYTVQLKEIEKNNGTLFPAILSRKGESRTAPAVYIDSILEGMESGNMELWEAAQKIADICRKNEYAASLWCKSTRGVVADEFQSNFQGLYREVQARRRAFRYAKAIKRHN